jgi:hypothetical protein
MICPSDPFIVGHIILGHSLYAGQTIFSRYINFMGIKNAEFSVDFKNTNLP